MADGKKSFVLYTDLIHTVKKMPNEKAGELFKHVLEYVNDLDPKTNDLIIELSFEPIKQQLKRDLNKWEELKVKRSKAGKISALNKANKRHQMSTHVESVQQDSTHSTVNVNGNVNVSVNGNGNVNKETNVSSQPPIENSKNGFWDSYHEVTGIPKTDKKACIDHWGKLTKNERTKALENIVPFFKSTGEKKGSRFIPKARTYIAERRFDDEFEKPVAITPYKPRRIAL